MVKSVFINLPVIGRTNEKVAEASDALYEMAKIAFGEKDLIPRFSYDPFDRETKNTIPMIKTFFEEIEDCEYYIDCGWDFNEVDPGYEAIRYLIPTIAREYGVKTYSADGKDMKAFDDMDELMRRRWSENEKMNATITPTCTTDGCEVAF